MKHLLTGILFLFAARMLHAQGGCLHTHHRLFALELVIPETWQWVGEPELVLVNEDSVPYMNPSFYVDHRFIASGPEEFLPNRRASLHKKHPGQTWTVWPRLPEDLYTILIPKAAQRYQVRVVIRHNGKMDTIYRHLPNARSLDICKNKIDVDYATTTILFDDGTEFTPIRIDLNDPASAGVSNLPVNDIYLRFDTKKVAPLQGSDSLLEVYRVRVYDGTTLGLIQSIPIEGTLPFHPNNRYAHIEQFPLFKDAHAKGIPDFRIMSDMKTDTQERRTETRFQQYVFDSTSGKYYKHAAISDAWNVKVDTFSGNITRYDIQKEPGKTKVKEYRFENEQWALYQLREIALENYPVQTPLPARECTAMFVSPGGMQPVKVLGFMLGEYRIRDSLTITNQCTKDQKVSIDEQYPGAKYFSAPENIPANSTASVRMEEFIIFTQSIQLYTREVRILLPDGTYANRAISYFTVLDKTAERDPRTGQVFRYVGEEVSDSLTVMVLEVDSLGRPSSYGPIIRSTGEKVGTWRNWREDGVETQSITYSKKMFVLIYNPERLEKDTQVRVRVKGLWQPVRTAPRYQGLQLYIPLEADSIHITSGKAFAKEPIDRQSMQNFSYIGHALLLPGEPFARSVYSKIPVTWNPDTYAVLWDYVYLSKAYPNADGQKRLQEILKTKYAGMAWFIEMEDNVFWLTIQPTSKERKAQILSQLQTEPGILAISQLAKLGKMDDTYAAPSVTIQFDSYVTVDSILAFAKEKKATLSSSYGAPNMCNFTFTDTLIDAAWIERMHRLTLEPGVLWISFQWYSRVYPDEAGE